MVVAVQVPAAYFPAQDNINPGPAAIIQARLLQPEGSITASLTRTHFSMASGLRSSKFSSVYSKPHDDQTAKHCRAFKKLFSLAMA